MQLRRKLRQNWQPWTRMSQPECCRKWSTPCRRYANPGWAEFAVRPLSLSPGRIPMCTSWVSLNAEHLAAHPRRTVQDVQEEFSKALEVATAAVPQDGFDFNAGMA